MDRFTYSRIIAPAAAVLLIAGCASKEPEPEATAYYGGTIREPSGAALSESGGWIRGAHPRRTQEPAAMESNGWIKGNKNQQSIREPSGVQVQEQNSNLPQKQMQPSSEVSPVPKDTRIHEPSGAAAPVEMNGWIRGLYPRKTLEPAVTQSTNDWSKGNVIREPSGAAPPTEANGWIRGLYPKKTRGPAVPQSSTLQKFDTQKEEQQDFDD